MRHKIYAYPNVISPNWPVRFDADKCTACNTCVEICQMDVLIPNPEESEPPIILFPDECWYCGSCVEHCPVPGALKLNYPLIQRARWKRKESGEHFHV